MGQPLWRFGAETQLSVGYLPSLRMHPTCCNLQCVRPESALRKTRQTRQNGDVAFAEICWLAESAGSACWHCCDRNDRCEILDGVDSVSEVYLL